MGIDLIAVKMSKRYTEESLVGAGALKGNDGDNGKDGKSAYQSALDNGFEGTEKEWIDSLKGEPGKDSAGEEDYRFKYVEGIKHHGVLYSYKNKQMRESGTNYTCVEYTLDGTEKRIRFSGATSGGSDRVAWCFTDVNNEVISKADFISGQTFEKMVLNIPDGAYKVYINGNNKISAHLEVSVSDLIASREWLPQLLSVFGKKLSYKENFTWKPMDTSYFAFTFDDSLDDIADVVNKFEELDAPCCFGCIPERLNEGITATETVGEIMLRAQANGGEVLAHGGHIITVANVDDENYLYDKFVCSMQMFYDYGLNVRGSLRTGGEDEAGNQNLCGDERTDKWMKLFYDYADLYGVSEPYKHARINLVTSSIEAMKAQIDELIEAKKFVSFIFHSAVDLLDIIAEAITYIRSKGGVVCNYAYVYDTFGSTTDEVRTEERITTLEKNLTVDGNEVKY